MRSAGLTGVAVVLTLSVLLSVAFFASTSDGDAGDEYSVHCGCSWTVGGGTSTLTVWTEGLPISAKMTIDIEYNPDAMELTSLSPLSRLDVNGSATGEGKYSVSVTPYLQPVMGELFEIEFAISDDALEGQYPVFINAKISGKTPIDSYGSMLTIGKMFGDLSGDGRIGVLDSLILKKHLNGVQTGVPSSDMDINRDGIVDNADHEMMKRHLSGADTGLDPVEGTLIFKGSETTREMTGAYVGYRVFPNGSADWEACDTDGNTIGTSKDGSFIMPEEGCIVLDEEVPSGKFRFVCFSLLQPNEVTLDTEGNKLNEYLIDAGKNKTTVTLTGASFSETGNNGSFVVSCRGSSYILSCLTNAEAAYAIKGDNLVIDLVLAGDMSNYLMLLYMDENADMGDKYMPSVGDRANYKLTLSIPLVVGSLNMFSTEIGLKVLSISDDWYTVELDGEIFEGKKPTATFPSGDPILLTLNNIEIEPLKTEKVNGKSCSVYEILIPGMPSKLKIWIEKNTDVLIKADTTVEGFAVTISLLSYNVQNLK